MSDSPLSPEYNIRDSVEYQCGYSDGVRALQQALAVGAEQLSASAGDWYD